MKKTKIEWCDSTWNPVTGCYHDCEYCYARTMVNRFGAKPNPDFAEKIVVLENPVFKEKKSDALPKINPKREPYPYGFIPTLHKYRLHDCEYKHQKGRNIFVCSMADLFGDWVPDEWIDEVMKACANAPKHNYLFLTKNPKRYFQYFEGSWQMIPSEFDFSKVTLFTGTTVTDQDDYDKYFNAGDLVYCDFLSIEPIHEMIDLAYFSYSVDPRIKWVIIGAETGNRKDKVVPEKEWIDEIVEQCDECGVPVFMKDSLVPIIGEENMRREFPKELKKL